MSISLGDPVGDALFTDALQSCSPSTWYGALCAVIAIFTKSFTVAEFSLFPAVIVGGTVVESFDIVCIAIDTFAIFKNFGFLTALQDADAVCPFVAGATSREFIAIDFVFVAKCCGAIAGAAFFERPGSSGDSRDQNESFGCQQAAFGWWLTGVYPLTEVFSGTSRPCTYAPQ